MRPIMARCLIDVSSTGVDRRCSCSRKNNRQLHIYTVISTKSSTAKIKERLGCVDNGIFRGIKPREWEDTFVKNDVTRNIDSSSCHVQALVPFVMTTIPDENTLFGSEGEFPSIVRAKKRPTSTSKGFKHIVVWFSLSTKKTLKRCCIVNNTSWQAINEVCGCGESFIPKFHGHGGLC
jgi:hypothetical protein